MNYSNRIICGPMVRISSLPFRLLALEYGADIVFSEELIDYRLTQCIRVENDLFNTIDFVVPGEDRPMLQIHKNREKDRLIVQLGTADPQRALNAARLVENDVAGIDINMGCPKKFSIQGGMGSALLDHPEKVKQVFKQTKIFS
jgi:tRNA-dihydrouridine synthase 2